MLYIKRILIMIIILFIFIWIFSIARCEILTIKYGNKFQEIYHENTMMGEIDYLKVLDYSDTTARVYYVSANKSSGDILTFTKEKGIWTYDNWEKTVWSDTGSASSVIWPYWWHFIYGGF